MRRWKPTSVRARLTLWSMGVQALTLAAMGAVLWVVVRANLIASIDREMEMRAHGLAAHWGRWQPFRRDGHDGRQRHFRRPPFFEEPAPPKTESTDAAPLTTRRPRLFTLEGRSIGPDPTERPWSLRAFARAREGQETFATVPLEGATLRIFSFPLRRGEQVASVGQMAFSLQEMNRALGGLTRALLALIPLSLLVTGVSGALQTNRMLRPVRRLTRTAASISAADLSERLPVVGEDEFSLLSGTFNGMLERLEQAFEQQRRFAADASHELRTPLTAIKAHASLALSGEKTNAEYHASLEAINRSSTLMMQIVQDLLLLARLDADKQQLHMERVPLKKALVMAVEIIGGQEHAPIQWDERTPYLEVLGDTSQLARLFSNLLNNAARHTPLEGSITLHMEQLGDRALVSVADTGVGIAPEHLPHLCERFYRVDSARSRKQGGTGLGLAISQGIAHAHGGQLYIESVLGQGTTVTVILPLLQNA